MLRQSNSLMLRTSLRLRPHPVGRGVVAALAGAITLAVGAQAPTASAAGNLLQNPSLEQASSGTPVCWKLGGYGTNSYTWTWTTDAHSGAHAEQLTISNLSSGDRKLVSAFDSGACAPAATPGTSYTVGAWYKTSSNPRFYVYYRSGSGGWAYWTESMSLPATTTWAYASWKTPAVPSGATNLSVGIGLAGAGSLTMDDLSLVASDQAAAPASSPPCPVPGTQTEWATPGAHPLTDAQAAACVIHHLDSRPGNAQYNAYVPTDAQLQAFHAATDDTGSLADDVVPERRYVTGRPGLSDPSTDDLIQWAAHKWGIPEDWIRAQMAVESWWDQTALGDRQTVSSSWYSLYPPQARIGGSSQVYESMGLSQVRWKPDGMVGAGTEPLRWKSTAFALDEYAAIIRYFYDGNCRWCGSGYSAGQQWPSIGAWYEPLPWWNSSAQWYVGRVQSDLDSRVWAQPGF
jgi:hypothetical protein